MGDFDINAAFIPALYKPPELLPITKYEREILYLVETFPVLVIVGQTGSGKTTQIPQFLQKAGWCAGNKRIGITQPRRVAAITIAMRVAEEVGCEVGKEVGYAVRFEDVTSQSTRIKFLTDGLLIREALMDPLLSEYSVIMVDEAHERSVSTDILLGLLKKIMKRRPDLRIIISSATIQARDFFDFFSSHKSTGKKVEGQKTEQKDERKGVEGEAEAGDKNDDDQGSVAALTVEGRSYPIDILHLESSTEDYVQKAVETVIAIHEKEREGDILVFLTGREEIDDAMQAVADHYLQVGYPDQALLSLPLYAGLTTEQQMGVFDKAPENTRKVIFATNIAEASVTIDGIVYVVDCGFVKIRVYDPHTSIETLVVTPISKASAIQRAGRAGRTKAGKCFRLYTAEGYDGLPNANSPEIQRSNLAPIILQLKALGIDNVLRFDYLSPPPSQLMVKALEVLYALGALDDYAKLTRPLGMHMAELALEPMMAKALLSAPSFGCLSEMVTIAAMESLGGNVWFYHDRERKKMDAARRKFAAEEGDHLTLLNAYMAFMAVGKNQSKFCHENHLNFKSMTRAVSVRAQLKRNLEQLGIPVEEPPSRIRDDKSRDLTKVAEQIRRCLTTGFFPNAAKMQPDGTFRTVGSDLELYAHPSSIMFSRQADWVIFHEIMETSKKTFIRDITKIEKGWLTEYAPAYYQVKNPGRTGG
ncbi:hypothetical protein jhhlp_002180 [Lomentospora prolificans]|uniref:RNA helicase n=1 Tax=Lomentospora prolificans TaxID=41688 RepID=A0A2N3NDD0_9PEZI|nr:hypothetical protein jhhlp_002180 [Lomentospora prolificans]